ncbi:hypothetical protein [Actinokineospora sp. NBRC 105648]|uniref:hypothetical protein n=1 Tax=Actinokineospora sp. NBRC 105648 TaxID=3032206 RepID=UPI0024A42E32|nr:hypothetical protein [Actinokineospora sp. NBRC 105648]GLZ43441.1 hypothetical protein Acsp05_70650 [Actinokineospora sp. NBRC 105648]
MTALLRYTVSILVHSQRYLAPVLLFLGFLGLFAKDAGSYPAPPVFASMAGAALVCSAWLTVALAGLEDRVRRMVTAVAVGRSWPLLVAVVLVVLGTFLLLACVAVAMPAALGNKEMTWLDVGAGLGTQLTATCVGTAIGLVSSRLVIRRAGYALITTLALLLVFLLVKGMPPVNPLIIQVSRTRTADQALLAAVGGAGAIAVVLLAVAMVATQAVLARRD